MRGVRHVRKRTTAVAIRSKQHVGVSNAFHFQIAGVSCSTNAGTIARSENRMEVAKGGFQRRRLED
jgi:hypothetical protein